MTAIGIDLGTTYSCVGVVKNGKVEILQNKSGGYTTPSYVAFTPDGVLIGEAAKLNQKEDPKNTIFNIKRVIGLSADEPVFKSEKAKLPYNIVEKSGEVTVETCVNGKIEYHLPEEISGKILAEMKAIAEDFLGEEVVDAVITIPARFNHNQRKKTREAAVYAGLNVLQLLHEPTAAAIAYGLQQMNIDDERKVLVYDLGGGTFDVTILNINADEYIITTTGGDCHLGGEDFDERMVAQCIKEYAKAEGINLTENKTAKYQLRRACENTKIALSRKLQDELVVELADGNDFSKRFRRAQFEALNDTLFEATMEAVDGALRDANVTKDEIEDIVLVGGSTRIPYVQTMLQKFFQKKVCKSLDPDKAVAYGAAIQAAQLCGNVDSEIRHFQVRDVIPLSLGVETHGGVMSVVIPRNTEFPKKMDSFYTTVNDYQTSICLRVYEGERAKVSLNNFLGSFKMNDIPSKLAGEPNFRVSFEINIDGMLHVTAIDTATGREGSILIEWKKQTSDNGQAAAEVKKAEENRNEDEQWKTATFAKISLEGEVKKIIRIVKTSRKLSEKQKKLAVTTCEDVWKWLKQHGNATAQDCRQQAGKLEQFREWQ